MGAKGNLPALAAAVIRRQRFIEPFSARSTWSRVGQPRPAQLTTSRENAGVILSIVEVFLSFPG